MCTVENLDIWDQLWSVERADPRESPHDDPQAYEVHMLPWPVWLSWLSVIWCTKRSSGQSTGPGCRLSPQ